LLGRADVFNNQGVSRAVLLHHHQSPVQISVLAWAITVGDSSNPHGLVPIIISCPNQRKVPEYLEQDDAIDVPLCLSHQCVSTNASCCIPMHELHKRYQ